MTKMRKLSGIFFRQKNEETGEYENVCFEELRDDEKKRVLKDKSHEWKDQLIMMLANIVNEIGEKFGIYKE